MMNPPDPYDAPTDNEDESQATTQGTQATQSYSVSQNSSGPRTPPQRVPAISQGAGTTITMGEVVNYNGVALPVVPQRTPQGRKRRFSSDGSFQKLPVIPEDALSQSQVCPPSAQSPTAARFKIDSQSLDEDSQQCVPDLNSDQKQKRPRIR